METFYVLYWTFVREIHWSPVDLPYKGKWRGALMFSLICAWTMVEQTSEKSVILRRNSAHYDVTLMTTANFNELLRGHSNASLILHVPRLHRVSKLYRVFINNILGQKTRCVYCFRKLGSTTVVLWHCIMSHPTKEVSLYIMATADKDGRHQSWWNTLFTPFRSDCDLTAFWAYQTLDSVTLFHID